MPYIEISDRDHDRLRQLAGMFEMSIVITSLIDRYLETVAKPGDVWPKSLENLWTSTKSAEFGKTVRPEVKEQIDALVTQILMVSDIALKSNSSPTPRNQLPRVEKTIPPRILRTPPDYGVRTVSSTSPSRKGSTAPNRKQAGRLKNEPTTVPPLLSVMSPRTEAPPSGTASRRRDPVMPSASRPPIDQHKVTSLPSVGRGVDRCPDCDVTLHRILVDSILSWACPRCGMTF